jgi:hypothetical protein
VDNIKMALREIGCSGVECTGLTRKLSSGYMSDGLKSSTELHRVGDHDLPGNMKRKIIQVQMQ